LLCLLLRLPLGFSFSLLKQAWCVHVYAPKPADGIEGKCLKCEKADRLVREKFKSQTHACSPFLVAAATKHFPVSRRA
jgi:hypothetical protein